MGIKTGSDLNSESFRERAFDIRVETLKTEILKN
jgi:hypothetical protein